MTERTIPMHKGEPDSPARILSDLRERMARLQAQELDVLRGAVAALDSADEHMQAATIGLEEVVDEIEKMDAEDSLAGSN